MPTTLRPVQGSAMLLFVLAGLPGHSASAQDLDQQVASCVACHPKSDVSATSVNPIIWGQNEGYIYVQLRDFKRAARASPSDAAMNALTQTMTDAQMQAIAKYVSAQPWPKPQDNTRPPGDPLSGRGAALMAYGDCGACHFNDWGGYSANPRLRGQTPAYLSTTIEELRSGKRGNSPGMSDLMRLYNEEEIKAIVAYLSSLD
jgi:cytochrome c553